MNRIPFVILSGFLFLLVGCLQPGQRLLKGEVELDGDLVLETSFGVSDSLDRGGAFRSLAGKSFQETPKWKPPSGSPSVVDLKGALRIRLIHVTTPFATVVTTKLTVVVDAKSKGEWVIPENELKRLEPLLK